MRSERELLQRYNIFSGTILGSELFAVVKIGLIKNKIIASTRFIPDYIRGEDMVTDLIRNGKLCDTYNSRTRAIEDLETLAKYHKTAVTLYS